MPSPWLDALPLAPSSCSGPTSMSPYSQGSPGHPALHLLRPEVYQLLPSDPVQRLPDIFLSRHVGRFKAFPSFPVAFCDS